MARLAEARTRVTVPTERSSISGDCSQGEGRGASGLPGLGLPGRGLHRRQQLPGRGLRTVTLAVAGGGLKDLAPCRR